MATATVDVGVPDGASTHLHDSVLDVFSTIVRCPLIERSDKAPGPCPREIAGTVAFSGSWTGYVSVVTSQQGARRIAASLLETESAQVDGHIRDALGEVVNIVTGSLRTRMMTPGGTWAIAMPVVTTGRHPTIEPRSHVSHVVRSYLMDSAVVDIHLVVASLGR